MSRVLAELALSPTRILDAGTEDATFVYWLADRYPAAQVMAVDIDADAIAACQVTRPASYEARVAFETTSFADLPPASFDLITVFDVFEHIKDDVQAAVDLARALAPGGTLLAHVPRNQWTTRSGIVHRVADEDAWQINAGHVRMGYSPEMMTDLLSQAGLRVDQVQTWFGRWGTLAFSVYDRIEHPAPLRLLSMPVTDICAFLDARKPTPEGNYVFARAVKSVA